MHDITLIIPTYNAAAYLPDLLAALKRQTLNFELLVVDSSSTDGSAEVLRRAADKFISIPTSQFDHGGTRTMAAQKASGNLLLFMTQDALPVTDDAFEKLVAYLLSHDNLGAVYGRQIPYENTSLFGKHLRYFNYPETSYVRTFEDRSRFGIKTAFLSDSFAAYKKDALQKIGWFKPQLILGEDMYAGAKLLQSGYSLGYCAQSAVYHAHSYTVTEELRRYFDIGVFHEKERWILDTFGNAEGEGIRFIQSEFDFLMRNGAYTKLPEMFIRIAAKYIGYKLGRNHKHLPSTFVTYCSMHRKWWKSFD
jgi:rhamnosyltransferase